MKVPRNLSGAQLSNVLCRDWDYRALHDRPVMLDDTITAIATPFGEGGLAVIRLSRPRAFAIAEASFRPVSKSSLPPSAAPSHTVPFGKIVRHGRDVDEVLISIIRAPRSFTREDVVEISWETGHPVILSKNPCVPSVASLLHSSFMRITITQKDSPFIVDCAIPGDEPDNLAAVNGPRVWIERKGHAWEIILHAQGGDPTHTLLVPDKPNQGEPPFSLEYLALKPARASKAATSGGRGFVSSAARRAKTRFAVSSGKRSNCFCTDLGRMTRYLIWLCVGDSVSFTPIAPSRPITRYLISICVGDWRDIPPSR